MKLAFPSQAHLQIISFATLSAHKLPTPDYIVTPIQPIWMFKPHFPHSVYVQYIYNVFMRICSSS
jgi:hypothetical protein